jgi:hypothetical protein
LALVAFLGFYLSSHTSLSCDRAAGSCRLLQQTVTGSSERTLPLADVTGAKLLVIHGTRHSTKIQVDLATKSEVIHLRSGRVDDDMRSFVTAVNAFVRAPAEPRLDAAYGDVWGAVRSCAYVVAVIFLVGVFVTPEVRASIDRGQQLLVFDIRPFGPVLSRRRTFPTALVLEARPYSITFGARGVLFVRLYMIDGTSWDVAGSTASGRRCREIADRINGVLGRPRA